MSSLHPQRPAKLRTAIGRLLYPETDYWRPETRGDCRDVPRPCPYVGCRYNNYLRVGPTGSIRFNFPRGVEPWDVPPAHSCALDIADRGGLETNDHVGAVLRVSGERIRQILESALGQLADDLTYTPPHADVPVTYHRGMIRGAIHRSDFRFSSLSRTTLPFR